MDDALDISMKVSTHGFYLLNSQAIEPSENKSTALVSRRYHGKVKRKRETKS